MGALSILAALVLLLLALPAFARAVAMSEQSRWGRAFFELARCLLAIAAAAVLFLIARGRPA